MKSKIFGTVVAGAVAGLMLGTPATAKDKKDKHDKHAKGACTSNECKGQVMKADGTAGTNECKGHAVDGVTKEECTKDGKGTWK